MKNQSKRPGRNKFLKFACSKYEEERNKKCNTTIQQVRNTCYHLSLSDYNSQIHDCQNRILLLREDASRGMQTKTQRREDLTVTYMMGIVLLYSTPLRGPPIQLHTYSPNKSHKFSSSSVLLEVKRGLKSHRVLDDHFLGDIRSDHF